VPPERSDDRANVIRPYGFIITRPATAHRLPAIVPTERSDDRANVIRPYGFIITRPATAHRLPAIVPTERSDDADASPLTPTPYSLPVNSTS